jgi:hypothetical protein
MPAMMIDDGKRVSAGGARLQWHMIPIADIDLIARNTRGEDSDSFPAYQSVLVLVDKSNVGRSAGAWLLDRANDVGTNLFVALQL